VKAAKAEGNYLQSEGENSTYRAEFIKFSWFEFSPQLQELGTIKSSLYGKLIKWKRRVFIIMFKVKTRIL